MNVHESITEHSKKQHLHLVRFAELDEQRETAIEAACSKCENGEPFDTVEINRITKQINLHAKQGISPVRKYVTKEMIIQYVSSRA